MSFCSEPIRARGIIVQKRYVKYNVVFHRSFQRAATFGAPLLLRFNGKVKNYFHFGETLFLGGIVSFGSLCYLLYSNVLLNDDVTLPTFLLLSG